MFVRMQLVVEFEGIVGVGEVLLGLRLYLHVGRDPVKKMGAVAAWYASRALSWRFFYSRAALSPPPSPLAR